MVNLDKLARLAPTHVLVNVDENRLETVQALRGWAEALRPQIIVTHPCTPADNLTLVDQLAGEFAAIDGVHERSEHLKRVLSAELAQTANHQRTRRDVLYLIWRDPWMTVATDTYISRMLALVGWTTLPDAAGGVSGAARYPVVRGDEAWLGRVERVLLSSEPYAFGAADMDAAQVLCPGAQVQCVDGELLSWYGARAVPGLRYLRALAAGQPG